MEGKNWKQVENCKESRKGIGWRLDEISGRKSSKINRPNWKGIFEKKLKKNLCEKLGKNVWKNLEMEFFSLNKSSEQS